MPRFNVKAPDGSIIPVDAPDGATPEQAIAFAASTWKGAAAPATNEAPKQYNVSPEFLANTAKSATRGEHPIMAQVADALSGLTTLPRTALNALSNWAAPEGKPNNLGNKLLSSPAVDTNSATYTAGQLADPYAMVLGGGVYKGVAAAPMVAKMGALASRTLAGGAAGAAVGAVSDQPLEGAAGGAAVGAGLSAALPPIIGGVARSAGWLYDVMRGTAPKIQAAKIATEAAGKNLGAIQAAGAAMPGDLSAAQAAYGINQDTWQALGEIAKRGDKESFYRVLGDQQKANDLSVLSSMAGGPTQTEAKTVRGAAQTTLNAITTPMRNTELDAANTAGNFITKADQAISDKYKSAVLALQNQSAEGGALAGQRANEMGFVQMQKDSLAAHGLQPLDTDALTAAIQNKLTDPTIGPNKVNTKVLSNVGNLIQRWTDNNGGVIDARALYEIRKSAVNNEIERLMSGADPKAQAKRAAGLAAEIKPLIDDAIVKAGGTGWGDYLSTFEQGMQQINGQKLAAKAMALYPKEPDASPQKFIDLVNGNDTRSVEKIFGPGKHDIADVMGGQYPALRAIADNLQRDMTMGVQAEKAAIPLRDMLDKRVMGFRMPGFVSPKITIANKLLDALEGQVNRKTMAVLSEGMRSGQSANAMLSAVPTVDKPAVANALAKIQGAVPYSIGGIQQTTQGP